MKKSLVLFICVICSGCITLPEESYPAPVVQKEMTERIVPNMAQLYPGMSFDEVQESIGASLKMGYTRCEDCEKGYKEIVMKNPYRVEIVKSSSKEYKVVYYYTSIKKADGFVADDELTPFVFEKDTFIGNGQDFLFNLRNL